MEDPTSPAYLREQAARCRRIADSLTETTGAAASLRGMAEEFEAEAIKIESRQLDGMPRPRLEQAAPKTPL